jgi:hypothetical protein
MTTNTTETHILIQYTDGTARLVLATAETIWNCIRADIGHDAVYAGGLFWTDADAAENDDGGRAVAKLWCEDGAEFTGDLSDLSDE